MVRVLAILLALAWLGSCQAAVTWVTPGSSASDTFREDTAVDETISVLSATATNTISYTIIHQTETGIFAIRNVNELYLAKPMDFETTQSHEIQLSAKDIINEEEAEVVYTVEVSDVNDNPPVFTSDTSLNLPVEKAIGTIVYVAVTDDADYNDTIVYAITGGNENGDFTINTATGELELTHTLNYTATQTYSIAISANDGVHTIYHAVGIYVVAVIWTLPTADTTDLFPEDKSTGAMITLSADTALVYTVISQDPDDNTFKIIGDTLHLVKSLDYETTESHVIVLRAIGNSGTADITYTVKVTDVNDVAPEFTSDTTAVVQLDASVGDGVYDAEVSDVDTVGEIVFTLTDGNTNDDFSINATTGEVILSHELTADDTYTLTIEVTDGVHTVSMKLNVKVNEVLWINPPKGTTDTINEDAPIGTVLTKLNATTAVSYLITSQTPDYGNFAIQSKTELYLASMLDYENATSYTIALKATGADGTTAVVTYTVDVVNINDERPEITSGTILVISQETQTNDVIYTASATDADNMDDITFSIAGGDDNGYFSIAGTTGKLTIAKTLMPTTSDDTSVALRLEASDLVQSDTLTLNIIIKTIPTFINTEVTDIPENTVTTDGYDVWSIDIQDLDGDSDPTLEIVDVDSDAGAFTISGNKVVTTATLDYENKQNYTITIKVTDTSTFKLSSTSTLTLSITDVNDVAPNITSPAALDLANTTSTGTVVYTITSYDPDTVGTIGYSETSGNTVFSVDATSGEITFVGTLDASSTPTHSLSLQVNDSTFVGVLELTITVKTAPVLVLPDSNTVEVAEDAALQKSVLTLNFTDVDGDDVQTYTIVAQSAENAFIIKGNTDLVVNAELDYETVESYTITLQVTDSSPLKLSSTATLTVNIQDVNDVPPVITSESTFEVREDQTAGPLDYTATATDSDTTEDAITFTLIGGNDGNDFSIDETTGVLSLVNSLNATENLKYNLEVKAYDGVNTASYFLLISVITAPVLEIPIEGFSIVENVDTSGPYDVWEFNVTDLDGDDEHSFNIETQSTAGVFETGSDSMTLVTTANFDYEILNSYTVTIKVTDKSTFSMSSTTTLTIHITDVNDNTPVFVSSTSILYPETTEIGTTVYVANTTDQDTEPTVEYTILDGNTEGVFTLDSASGNLSLAMLLTELTYSLTIQADDSINTVNLTLVVNVATVPQFVFPADNLTFAENTDTSGSLVVWTFVITDRDGDSDPIITIVSQSVPGTFSISGNTLVTTASFDHEATTNYSVILNVTDTSEFQLSSEDTLWVIITDENDEVPEFTSLSMLDVAEYTAISSLLITIETTDADTNAIASYSITDGNTADTFSLNSSTGELLLIKVFVPATIITYTLTIEADDNVHKETQTLTINVKTVPTIDDTAINITENTVKTVVMQININDIDSDGILDLRIVNQSVAGTFAISEDNTALVTTASFDYESIKIYTVEIQVTDDSSLKLSSTGTVTVNILDENDVPPSFTSNATFNLREDTNPNAVIHSITTYDPDKTGSTTYSITDGNTNDDLSIDSTSGELKLLNSLNATVTLTYTLEITADDTENQATFNLTINVITAPVLVFPGDNIEIPENTDTTDPVLTFEYTDVDNDTMPTYKVISESVDGTFYISDDGLGLVTSASFDFEVTSEYTVTIQITDTSEFEMSSTSTLTVSITDVNDNPPTFNNVSPLELPYNQDTGATGYIVSTTDPDTDQIVEYSIIGGNTNDDFDVHATNGSLLLVNSLDGDRTLQYTLVIEANDTKNTASFDLTVDVKTKPVFSLPDVDIGIKEDAELGVEVWTLTSTDLDGDPVKLYKILSQSENDVFLMNDENSKIMTNSALDYETTTNYTITLQVTDNSTFAMSSTATLTVSILDVNDVMPSFTSDDMLEIPETIDTGTTVYNATYSDEDTEGTHTFTITGGNTYDSFSINPSTGELILDNKLNPTTTDDLTYNLGIQVTDSINTASMTLEISVKTVPVMNLTDVSINIPENETTSGGYEVWTPTSTDLDDDADEIYDIVSQSESGVFFMNDEKSIIMTTNVFDYETTKSYSVTLRVTDSSTFALTSTGVLTITISDVNDNAPNITSNSTLDVWVDTPTGGSVLVIESYDEDTTGESATYTITDGDPNSKFALDATSGNLTIASALDDQTLTYELEITVTDSMNPSIFTLTVNVKTEPMLVFPVTNIEIPESSSSDEHVWAINWTDTDGDQNPQLEIISQSVANTFKIIDANLFTNATFDYEFITNYTITIKVTDSSTLALSSTYTLTVYITDVNDNAPVFNSNTTLDIREDMDADSFVYIAEASDADSNADIEYTIIDGDTDNDFTIDTSSGNITLAQSLNASRHLTYSLVIMADDSMHTIHMTLDITVKTAPKLTLPDTDITIVEKMILSRPYLVLELQSTDADGDTHPLYTIADQNNSGTFFVSDDQASLVTNTTFDYLNQNEYTVTIVVTDNSRFKMSSSTTFTVHISDTNDLPPYFTSTTSVDIAEGTAEGVSVYTAVAEDNDTNSVITYTILGGNTNNDFVLGSSSGELTLNNPLHPNTTLVYYLQIEASDTNNTAVLNLTVYVKTAPILYVDGEISIEENIGTPPTNNVTKFKYTDLDGDDTVTYAIVAQDVPDMFYISDDNMWLVTDAIFDFEDVPSYELTIMVTDSSSLTLSTNSTLTVYITDLNDVTPTFSSNTTLDLSEKTEVGEVVYTAKADDVDTIGIVLFSITGGDTYGEFSIDLTSGELTLEKTLQPKLTLMYNITIEADDSVHTAIMHLIISVNTEPILYFPDTNPTIEENTDTSRTYTIWQCASGDLDEDDAIYNIKSQTVDGIFRIVDNTRLVTEASFDYERINLYEVVVMVTDTSSLALSSTGTLTVSIIDLNDIIPNFTSLDSTAILENTKADSVVYTAVADDIDTVGNVTYSIIGGDPNNDFSIDPVSGNLTLVNEINISTTLNYSLVIRADDSLHTADLNLFIDIEPDIDECAPKPCVNGTCRDGIGEYICECVAGFNGTNCSTEINECDESPCSNGGTCDDLIDDYRCTCVAGYDGKNCTSNIDDCATTPCQNGGTCMDGIDEYNCTCVVGYNGTDCEKNIDDCDPNPCQNGATCGDEINGYTCTCVAGYDGDMCDNDIDDCASETCTHNGTCEDGINTFTCKCAPGYMDTHCETNINECEPDPCQNEGFCRDGINGYTCICQDGYNGTNCTNDIDECESNPCQYGGSCEDEIDVYTCSCVTGYDGTNCENNIEDCVPNPCKHEGTCTDGVDAYTCTCAPGYNGTDCEQNIDDCEPVPCKNGSTCIDGINGYTCDCSGGYNGTNCTIDIDECESNPCQNGGTCANEINRYTCSCVAGYDGINCENNIDECDPNPCKHEGNCTDGVDVYTCTCAPGYNGTDCGNDIDDCESVPCKNGSTCIDGINGYTCNCSGGYNGTNCTIDIDECESNPCQNGGSCEDEIDGYTCSCVTGYDGTNCEKNIDNCDPNPCKHEATCADGVDTYTCTCAPGYDGTDCEHNIEDCDPNPCANNGSCADGVNEFTCTCTPGYFGLTCVDDVDECETQPCVNGGNCTHTIAAYTCSCLDGYNGTNCEINVDECVSQPCQNDGICTDLVNAYNCSCTAGFNGDNCEQNIDDCTPNPCENGGTCTDGINVYTCACAAGYHGTTCNSECVEGSFGENCAQSCDCRNGTVSCDHINGTCYCTPFYSGKKCEKDIDECTDETHNCVKANNEDCNNIEGGFECSCLIGYTRNEDNASLCGQVVTTASPTTQLAVGKAVIVVSLTLDIDVVGNLQVTTTYKKYKDECTIQITLRYTTILAEGTEFEIIINHISKGSLIVDYSVKVSEEIVPDIGLANVNIASNETGIQIFDQVAYPKDMKIDEQPVTIGQPVTDAFLCEVYEASSIGKCSVDYTCKVTDGKPGCQLDKSDNLLLILGLGIGIPVFFMCLALIILCIAYYQHKMKLLSNKYRDNEESSDTFAGKVPLRTITGPRTGFPDSTVDPSHRYAPSIDEFHRQYDNQVERDTNNFSWDYLYNHVRPGEQYKIRRPTVDRPTAYRPTADRM